MRFGKIVKDPRFKRPKKSQTKVKLDDRFAGMLNDADFEQSHQDSRGRSLDVATSKSVNLKKFYQISDAPHSGASGASAWAANKDQKDQKIVEKADQEDEDADEDIMEEMARIARGEVVLHSSDDESSHNEDNEDNEDDDRIKDGIIKLQGDTVEYLDLSEEEFEDILQTENVDLGDPTHRFAVMNMDWDHVTAMDLFKLFDGFKPPADGFVKSVTIYPSEFGREQMQREDVEGPPAEIFKQPSLSDSEDQQQAEEAEEEGEEIELFHQEDEEDGADFNQEALRKYQLERLRYFYAVVECDSVRTSAHIVRECDGNEYEHSACTLDLRFIPDDMTFPPAEEAAKDQACGVVDGYQPPSAFTTNVLQHSRLKLTWDDDDLRRKEVTHRQFTKEDLKNLDFDAYLASEHGSDDSEDDEDEEALKQKYRALLAGINDNGPDNNENENEGDMEVMFAPGLSNLASKLLDKRREKDVCKDETVFETERRLQKERRRDKKAQFRSQEPNESTDSGQSNDSEESILGSDVENDPFFAQVLDERKSNAAKQKKNDVGKNNNKNRKRKSAEELEREAKERAELELLMIDDGNDDKAIAVGGKHFDYDEIVKQETKSAKKIKRELKKKNKKMKQGHQTSTTAAVVDDFEINTKDPRFEALFTSSQFAIDPSNSKFKKTKAMKKLLAVRSDLKNVVGRSKVEDEQHQSASMSAKDLARSIKQKRKNNIQVTQ